MQFNGILLDAASRSFSEEQKEQPEIHTRKDLKLWGLSLGMTLDLLSYMNSTPSLLTYCPHDEVTGLGTHIAPSLT